MISTSSSCSRPACVSPDSRSSPPAVGPMPCRLPGRAAPTWFKLLRYLMANANRVLSKGQILDHVWSYDFRGDDSIVESYISYLRRKVDTVEPRLIHTLRGVGYVLRLPS